MITSASTKAVIPNSTARIIQEIQQITIKLNCQRFRDLLGGRRHCGVSEEDD